MYADIEEFGDESTGEVDLESLKEQLMKDKEKADEIIMDSRKHWFKD